jgi:hypothetical protein
MALKPLGFSADSSSMSTRLALAAVAALAALALPAGSSAALTVGVTDDVGLGGVDGGVSFLATLGDLGFRENRVSVVWDPDAPGTIPNKAAVDVYVANAAARGVRIVFAVYPSRSTALTASPAAVWQFTAFLELLARAYPQVTDYIVGNEPNQPRFWRPQFDEGGRRVACAAYAGVLAAAYDALKAVNPAITVIGLGLSPRGNDNPLSRDNASTSPIRCLRDLGAAYRASRRAKPIMDELAFHAHPERDTQPVGYSSSWPKVGLTDLARLKQAVWDAFNGTAQPTFAETGRSVVLPVLQLRIAEVGWQVGVVPSAQGAYVGTENVPTTDEEKQAANYVDAVRMLACDPSVRSLLFFGLVDEPDLARWQAGLLRADGSLRPSYSAVKSLLAASGASCAGSPLTWTHTATVLGSRATFPSRRTLPKAFRAWGFTVGVQEDAKFVAGLFRLPRAPAASQWRSLISRSLAGKKPVAIGPALRLTGRAKAPFGRSITFKRRTLKPGYYVYGIRLTAEMNPARASFLMGKPFRLGPIDHGKPKTRKSKAKRKPAPARKR